SETGTGDADMGPCAKVPPPDNPAQCRSPTRRFWHIDRRVPLCRTNRDIKAKDSMAPIHAGPHGGEEAQVGPQERGQEEGVLPGTQGTKGEEAVSRGSKPRHGPRVVVGERHKPTSPQRDHEPRNHPM